MAVSNKSMKSSKSKESSVLLASTENSNHEEPPRVKIYWQEPTFMISSFVGGIALATAHHFFYHSLNGQIVGHIEQQQSLLRIGNFLSVATAFLLKATTGIAYCQWLWRVVRRHNISLRTIDRAFAALGNVLVLRSLELWFCVNIGVFLILLSWGLPLLSLFPPATLSVVLREELQNTTIEVYHFNASGAGPFTEDIDWFNRIARPHMLRMQAAVASSGIIAPLSPPIAAQNFSYVLEDRHPLIKCESIPEVPQGPFVTTLEGLALNASLALEGKSRTNKTEFDVSALHWNIDYGTTGNYATTGNGTIIYFGGVLYKAASGSFGVDYNTTLTAIDDFSFVQNKSMIFAMKPSKNETVVFSCALKEADLTVRVNFLNGFGTTTVVKENLLPNVSLDRDTGYPQNDLSRIWFDSLARFFMGTKLSYRSCDQDITDDFRLCSIQVFEDTNIDETTFADTVQYNALSQVTEEEVSYLFDRVVVPRNNLTLGNWIEQFALNASLSLLSDPFLTDRQNITATISTLTNIYRYQPKNLLISYGVSILSTLLVVVLGTYSLYMNGASYDMSVSTFGATMQHPDLRDTLMRKPLGAEPLEDETGKVKMRFKSYSLSQDVDARQTITRWAGFMPQASVS